MSGTTTIEDTSSQISFQYANECDLEIHCSPFGLSGLYIKINGTNLMGIGSTMGLITGSTKGLIHYNDSNDLIDQKYKLYVVVDDEGMLRIDFTKIFTLNKGKDDQKSKTNNGKSSDKVKPEKGSLGSNGHKSKDDGLSDDANAEEEEEDDGEDKYEEEELPTLIFRGKCPEGRPDNVEPFIGIFSFERES
ncbi:uncharacterized protein RJT20DRAFT_40446 [Scheffersomyces xylosifermentans]|uniref:uncharacterized protein n=1 Tax=Scheffersomyces xylosifermentans TaxID=1304137 RepID=UPI00315C6643